MPYTTFEEKQELWNEIIRFVEGDERLSTLITLRQTNKSLIRNNYLEVSQPGFNDEFRGPGEVSFLLSTTEANGRGNSRPKLWIVFHDGESTENRDNAYAALQNHFGETVKYEPMHTNRTGYSKIVLWRTKRTHRVGVTEEASILVNLVREALEVLIALYRNTQ